MTHFSTKKIQQSSIKKPGVIPTTPKIKKTKKITRVLIFGFLILLVGFFGIYYIVQGIGGIKIGTGGDTTVFTPIIYTKDPEVIIPPKKGVINILIVGIGGAGHQAGELADSIMLASLDEEKKSVTMISIPRDLYVSYGTGEGAGKINALYPIGISQKQGVSLLANKVSEITGQSIHHYLVVDFAAFRYIVNALDGIEIDVTKDLYDNEYPDYNYGYTIFSVKKGIQIFDGETALRYARSRHSTSDMDRSRRQQQIINAIKTKSLSAGVITSPTKISEILDATRKNINTDLTVGDVVSIGSTFMDIEKSAIHVYNLGNDCVAYTNCSVGAYLYNPSMAYFGGAWSLIPEGAKIHRLSYYDRIHRFVDFVFQFPGIHTTIQPIIVIYTNSSLSYAKNLLMEMRKIGINFDNKNVLKNSTGAIKQSHINIYWNEQYGIGIDPKSEIMEALKTLDIRIPVNFVTNNEYVTTDGPKIEIVLGDDYRDFFTFSKAVDYLPLIEMPVLSGTIVSGEKKIEIKKIEKNPNTKIDTTNQDDKKEDKNSTPSPYKVNPGEWEQL